jgi:hypothetical protein
MFRKRGNSSAASDSLVARSALICWSQCPKVAVAMSSAGSPDGSNFSAAARMQSFAAEPAATLSA